MRASYVDAKGETRLDRDILLMPVGDGEVSYAFDVQRLRGGKTHTWCFHGCESQDVALNVPMEPEDPKAIRWIDRTLEGKQKSGAASATLQATWTSSSTRSRTPLCVLTCGPKSTGSRRPRSRRSVRAARASASGPQENQSTGLWACWSRLELVSETSRSHGARGSSWLSKLADPRRKTAASELDECPDV